MAIDGGDKTTRSVYQVIRRLIGKWPSEALVERLRKTAKGNEGRLVAALLAVAPSEVDGVPHHDLIDILESAIRTQPPRRAVKVRVRHDLPSVNALANYRLSRIQLPEGVAVKLDWLRPSLTVLVKKGYSATGIDVDAVLRTILEECGVDPFLPTRVIASHAGYAVPDKEEYKRDKLMVECTCQPGMLVGVLPVDNRVANQEVKESVVSGRDCPAHVGFVESGIAEKKLSLGDELFRQIGNHAAGLIYEIQVRMQPDLIGTNETKEIGANIFREPLQFRGCDVAGKDHLDEHGRIVAPVDADTVIDPLHERIARVPRSQAIDPVRNSWLVAHSLRTIGIRASLSPAYRAAGRCAESTRQPELQKNQEERDESRRGAPRETGAGGRHAQQAAALSAQFSHPGG